MTFTGKAACPMQKPLPAGAEDLSCVVAAVAPREAPLLDCLGDGAMPATDAHHEWIEDRLLANTDRVAAVPEPAGAATGLIAVENPGRFRRGDRVRAAGLAEVMVVTSVRPRRGQIVCRCGRRAARAEALGPGHVLHILGREPIGDHRAAAARFARRVRVGNRTRSLTADVQPDGSARRRTRPLRTLLRELERGVVRGADLPAGRRSAGILDIIRTNVLDAGGAELTRSLLAWCLAQVHRQSSSRPDTLAACAAQKRRLDAFVRAGGRPGELACCRTVACGAVPPEMVLLLDRSRIDVLPLAGRSFHYRPSGGAGGGRIVGEYTLELRNEIAHGVLRGLRTGSRRRGRRATTAASPSGGI